MAEHDDPIPSIRAILTAGFVGSNLIGLAYIAIRGLFLDILRLDLFAMLGGILGVGAAGMMAGAVGGLSVKLLLNKSVRSRTGWWVPIICSATCSALVGLGIVAYLSSMAWGE
jgi:hypothetical protein